jgi:hypothetical protein
VKFYSRRVSFSDAVSANLIRKKKDFLNECSEISFVKKEVSALAMAILIVALLTPSAAGVIPAATAQASQPPNSTTTATTHGVPLPKQDPMPSYARAILNQAEQEIAGHPGWTADVSWNPKTAHLDYIGPADQDPGVEKDKIKGSTIHSIVPTVSPISSSKNQQSDNPSLDSCGKFEADIPVLSSQGITSDINGAVAIYKEVATYSLLASSSSHVWFYIPLNAMNSNNAWWLQVTPYYDSIGADRGGWHVRYDVISTSTDNDLSGFPATSSAITMNNDDNRFSYIEGTSTAGVYDFGQLIQQLVTGMPRQSRFPMIVEKTQSIWGE